MTVPVDKASSNFGIVCKKSYLDVTKNELGISDEENTIGDKVYKPMYQEAKDLSKSHEQRFWVHLVFSYTTSTNAYLYFIGLENDINADSIFGLLQRHHIITINGLQSNFCWHWVALKSFEEFL